ncbi:putative efflux pump membrane fusion protein [Stieleria magnilauensis]|uniref:Efflux pump membrane fusion protein n=1 Tax=Stieleria magnilauensis TaxID=2527963 RepID=A0ABX5XK52_9BACT|nr:putative efflux pump membrane fusion protein [Planctomycetes bacterium TBK1r]
MLCAAVGRLVVCRRPFPSITIRRSLSSVAGNAIAEVTGRINVLADTFDDGEVLQEGTLIAQIDPRDNQSALDAAKADLQSQREQLEEISRSMSNVADLIALREEQVAIAKSELDRLRELSDRNNGSRSELERAASSHLESKTALQNLQNELRLDRRPLVAGHQYFDAEHDRTGFTCRNFGQ